MRHLQHNICYPCKKMVLREAPSDVLYSRWTLLGVIKILQFDFLKYSKHMLKADYVYVQYLLYCTCSCICAI
jgi:hypothetical protein